MDERAQQRGAERAFLDERDPERAWQAFLEACLPTVDRAARHVVRDGALADDIAAEVLARIHSKWPELLRRFDQGGRRASFRTWLAVVARNLAVDVLRTRRGRSVMPRAISRLRPWERRLWQLIFVEDRTLTGAGQALGAEGLWEGELHEVAAAVHTIHAALADGDGDVVVRPSGATSADPTTGLDPEPAAPSAQLPSALAERCAAHDRLRTILEDLDADERQLIRVYFLRQCTAAEVATVLGLRNAEHVYERIRSVMKRLRSAAEADDLEFGDLQLLADFPWGAALEGTGGTPQ